MHLRQPRFALRLAIFFAPVLALFSVPFLVLCLSREILEAKTIARMHATSRPDIVFGPAYTNPDKRYKLESLLVHDVPIVAIGSSRVMEFRASFFDGDQRSFYNAGGLISRLWHFRRVLRNIPTSSRVRYAILGLDQWSFNDNWSGANDDPQVDTEYTTKSDALAQIRYGLLAWPDILHGKITFAGLAFGNDNLGVNARMRGNGFRQDGSYVYVDIPRNGVDLEFRDTLSRIREQRNFFEGGLALSERALRETEQMLAGYRDRGIEVAVFLPPFAPRVLETLRSSSHHAYLNAVASGLREITDRAGVPLLDATDCAAVACADDEFIDGFHPGDALVARLLLVMAPRVPWLAGRLAGDLPAKVAASRGKLTVD